MILDLFYIIASTVLKVISFLFGLIPFDQFTDQLTEAIAWLFYPISYFGGVLDVAFFASCLRALILFEIAWLIYKIILAMMHWIKLKGHNPSQ